MPYEINKELVLSTGHIQKCTSEILNMKDKQTDELAEVLIWERSEFGYKIYIPLHDGPVYDIGVGRICPELPALMMLASLHDCKWLVFDADGPQHEEFPKFEW